MTERIARKRDFNMCEQGARCSLLSCDIRFLSRVRARILCLRV